MVTKRNSERGQAIILIAFGLIGLIGLTALAIDGGNAYSDRRHAQNAADTAAFAGALAKINNQNYSNATLDRAASNGYVDTDPTSGSSSTAVNVEVYNPPTSGQYSCATTPSTCNDYIQVIITSHVKTYFAPIVGIQQITNKVNAVARAKPGSIAPMFGGSAVVALDPNGCKALNYSGNANVTLKGTGLFANSTCSTAFYNSSSTSKILTTPCLTTVGGYTYTDGKVVYNPPNPNCPTSGAQAYPAGSYTLPNITCGSNAAIQSDGTTMSAGNWPGNFPPNGVKTLSPGTYCIGGNFSLSGGDTLTGNGVTIVMNSGKVSINTNGTVNLTAPTTGTYKGLMMYLPPTNGTSVTLNGGTYSQISGTILAPSASVNVLGGGSAAGGIQSQIIGFDVNLGGGSDTILNFNADQNYQPPLPPDIELTQ